MGPSRCPAFSRGAHARACAYLLDRAAGVLFIGDAAAGGLGAPNVRRTQRMFTEDVPSAAISLAPKPVHEVLTATVTATASYSGKLY